MPGRDGDGMTGTHTLWFRRTWAQREYGGPARTAVDDSEGRAALGIHFNWSIAAFGPETVGWLRHEIVGHLHRHAEDDAAVEMSAVVVTELLANVVRHAPGPAEVWLTWRGHYPILTVRDQGPGFVLRVQLPDDPGAEGGRGLYLAAQLARQLEVVPLHPSGCEVVAELAVVRRDALAGDMP